MKNEKENMEVDNVKTLENMINRVLENQELYFKLLIKVTGSTSYVKAVTNNLLKMKMPDQLQLLKGSAAVSDICVRLCEKYGFEIEEEV